MSRYGSKETYLMTEAIMDRCPNCGAQNSVSMSIYQQYVHIYWIPCFPTRKIGETQCARCQQVLKENQFTPLFHQTCNAIKTELTTPIWTFSGVAVLGVLIVLFVILSYENTERNARLVSSPQRGDIYEIKKKSHSFTLYKVDHVVADTVYLLSSKFESNTLRRNAYQKMKADNAFDPEPFPVLKMELKNMFDKGEIIGAER